jgi:hypothetical protein
MIETALVVNGQDCTNGCGNTPEEYEAIAITLFRIAQAIRQREHGLIQCLKKDGGILVSVIVHNRELTSNEDDIEFPIIETLHCTGELNNTHLLSSASPSLMENNRPAKAESR